MLLSSLEKVLLCSLFRSNPVILLPNMMGVTPWCSQYLKGRGEIHELQGPKEQGVIFKAMLSEEKGYGDFFSGTVPVHREVASEVSPYLSPMAFLGHLRSASCVSLVQHKVTQRGQTSHSPSAAGLRPCPVSLCQHVTFDSCFLPGSAASPTCRRSSPSGPS